MAMTKKGARIPRICDACGAGLQIERKSWGADTYNELYLTLAGGYGSFVDDITHRGDRPYTFTLCEACAARLCREFKFWAPLREHHTSTVCECPDRPVRDARGFPLPCECPVCQAGRETR